MGVDTPENLAQRLAVMEEEMRTHGALLASIDAHVKKTQRYIFWGRMTSMAYLVLIIAPLILAAVYLPPIIRHYVGSFQEILNLGTRVQSKSDVMHTLQEQLNAYEQSQ